MTPPTKSKPAIALKASDALAAVTSAGNTTVRTNAPCQGVSAVSTSCLNRVEHENRHAS